MLTTTLRSRGDMPGAVWASCVILTEPHEVRAVQPTRGHTTAQTTQLIRGGSGGDCALLTPPEWPGVRGQHYQMLEKGRRYAEAS